MPQRWVWSLVDVAALAALSQAALWLQRAPSPPQSLDLTTELSCIQRALTETRP